MNKRQIIKWLEGKREEALKNAAQKYECELECHREILCKEIELEATAQKIDEYFQKAYESYQEWKNKHNNNEHIKIVSYYAGVGRFLEETVNSEHKVLSRMMLYDIEDTSAEFSRIKTLFSDTNQEIKSNYKKLIANVQKLNAESACEYLNKLGFDTSDIAIDKKACTTLRDDIDQKYLFVKEVEKPVA